jgi:rod shape-determining protein MreC
VAVYTSGQNRSRPQRGPIPGLRFALFAFLSVALMFLDQRGGWLERVRYGLQAAAYPLQLAMNSPSAAWNWTHRIFEARADLQAENRRLRDTNRRLELQTLRYAALERENAQLRGLRRMLPGVAEQWLPGEVIGVESSNLRQRMTIGRGAVNGVFKAQAVISDGGLLGQTLRVGPWSTEVILISDPEHAVPVQIARNGLRTIAVGTGDISAVTLPYLPIQSDVRAGDLLVTSGLGGVFPAGYPVAKVASVRRDGSSPLAQVQATPLARLDRDRLVAFVWFKAGHPAAPAPAADATTGGSPDARPLAVPPPLPAPVPVPVPVPPAAAVTTEPAPTPAATSAAAAPATASEPAPAPAPEPVAPSTTPEAPR